MWFNGRLMPTLLKIVLIKWEMIKTISMNLEEFYRQFTKTLRDEMKGFNIESSKLLINFSKIIISVWCFVTLVLFGKKFRVWHSSKDFITGFDRNSIFDIQKSFVLCKMGQNSYNTLYFGLWKFKCCKKDNFIRFLG